jgi:hypothetical protein
MYFRQKMAAILYSVSDLVAVACYHSGYLTLPSRVVSIFTICLR